MDLLYAVSEHFTFAWNCQPRGSDFWTPLYTTANSTIQEIDPKFILSAVHVISPVLCLQLSVWACVLRLFCSVYHSAAQMTSLPDAEREWECIKGRRMNEQENVPQVALSFMLGSFMRFRTTDICVFRSSSKSLSKPTPPTALSFILQLFSLLWKDLDLTLLSILLEAIYKRPF